MTAESTDPRKRFEAMAAGLDQPGSPLSLAEAALWVAAEEYPDLDVRAWLGRLDVLGDAVRQRVTPDMGTDATAAALNRFLFDEQGFRGNTEDYYDPRNSFLNDVLERRIGIPITLSVVYMEVAARAGVTVRGVGLPGHFIVRVDRPDGRRLLDPFNGGVTVDEAGCRVLVQQVYGAHARFDPTYLRPVTPRQILIRMLSNLKGIHLTRGDWRRALAAVDRILLLAPEALGEMRDRGGLHVRLGESAAAIRDWETYLRQAPEAADAERVRGQLRALRQALAALN